MAKSQKRKREQVREPERKRGPRMRNESCECSRKDATLQGNCTPGLSQPPDWGGCFFFGCVVSFRLIFRSSPQPQPQPPSRPPAVYLLGQDSEFYMGSGARKGGACSSSRGSSCSWSPSTCSKQLPFSCPPAASLRDLCVASRTTTTMMVWSWSWVWVRGMGHGMGGAACISLPAPSCVVGRLEKGSAGGCGSSVGA